MNEQAVVLINAFEVPGEADQTFLAGWDSEESFRAATGRPEFREISREYPLHSSVYTVISADERWTPGAHGGQL